MLLTNGIAITRLSKGDSDGKLAERPFYLELTDSKMECFIEALKSLVEERKTFLKRLLKFD